MATGEFVHLRSIPEKLNFPNAASNNSREPEASRKTEFFKKDQVEGD